MAKMLLKILEHVLVFLFVHILKTVQLQRLFFTLLGFLCSFSLRSRRLEVVGERENGRA